MKTEVVRLRVTAEEKKLIEELAAAGVIKKTLSSYILGLVAEDAERKQKR